MSMAVRDLGFGYGHLPVLEGISAEARPGRVTAVFGPNAVGKSTLLRCAIGALRPSAGEATLGGRAAWRLRGRALAERVAYVPQRASVAVPFTVREVVALGRYALPVDHRRVESALERLELSAVAERPFPALSVGQQQRVALARALAQLGRGGCLVLDEPTAAMDLRHARKSLALLRELAGEGATVLIAMHDLAAGAEAADEAWLLAPGATRARAAGPAPAQLRAAGPVEEVMEVQRLQAVFGIGFRWLTAPGGRRVLLPG